jgi:ribonuclease E
MREVEKEVKKSLENDKARVSVGRISTFGLLEMSRQRLKATLATGSYLPCPHCDGAGRLKSPESQAVSLLRKIHASAAKGQVSRIDAQLPRDVAAYLLNHKREELVTMERDHHLQIHIHGNRDFLADQVEIEIQKKEKDKAPQPEFVAAGLLPSAFEESTEKQAVEPDQEEAPDSSAVPAKKRRRRKRRKAPEGTAAEPASEETTPAQAPSVDTGQSEQAGQTAIQTDTAASPLSQEEADEEVHASPLEPAPVAAKKPQRRRRTPSKKKSTITDSTEQATPPEHAVEQTTTDQTDKTPVQEDKPKRQRPRRAPRKTPPQSDPARTEPQQAAEGHSSHPVQVAAEASTADVSAPAKKAPARRPRRTAVKKAPSDAVEQSGAEQADAADQKIAAQPAEEKPKPRRRRPARKKTEPEPATEA